MQGWDSTNSTSTKNSRFLSNKTKKLTKIVNRKRKINKKKLGHYELVLFVPPIKSSKSELFISFNMEFKLKTSENYLKSNKKNLGQYEIADFYQIKRKNLQK